VSKNYKTIKVDVIYWEIRNLFGEEIRIAKHRPKLQECGRFRKKSSFFLRFSFEISWRNVLEWKYNLIFRAISFNRWTLITQAYGFRAQIITRLNSQPCSKWRYSSHNQIIFPKYNVDLQTECFGIKHFWCLDAKILLMWP